MKYNPDIHHRRSIRLQSYDYGQAGLYFITICAWQRQCIFGSIEDGIMRLNPVGEIARDEWMRTAEMRSNIDIAEFVVMPNHIHGIIAIDGGNDGGGNGRGTMHRAPTNDGDDTIDRIDGRDGNGAPTNDDGDTIDRIDGNGDGSRGTMHRAPTPCDPTNDGDDRAPTTRAPTNDRTEKFGKPTSNTIPTIVRGYKAAVTKQVNILRSARQCPVWQRNYYEHIIRTKADYQRIATYIINNPCNWQEDSLHHEK